MSDSQRQVKMVAEQALASLLERAKRLQLTSVCAMQHHGNDDDDDGDQEQGQGQGQEKEKENLRMGEQPAGVEPNVVVVNLKKSKHSPPGAGIQRAIAASGRKPRKLDLEPSPPPPSPRELCLIAELRDEYNQTDQLIDQMLTDATNLGHEMNNCTQIQRDLSLVQEIELETTKRSLDTLFGALTADLERNDLKELMLRCDSALERTKERRIKNEPTIETSWSTISEQFEQVEAVTTNADELPPIAAQPDDQHRELAKHD
ncbi:uncharacterized protein LOC135440041 [Drosophila montana]|uniref:uncharacterized protein LOC135440041 n=1 Tax=Drosophila montana TaxID=40370 RepID=UPI00313CDA61